MCRRRIWWDGRKSFSCRPHRPVSLGSSGCGPAICAGAGCSTASSDMTSAPPPKRPRAAQAELVDLLGYRFKEPQLLVQALTHPSLQPGSAGRGPYERLEFLGDRVLGLVVAEMLYHGFPGEN